MEFLFVRDCLYCMHTGKSQRKRNFTLHNFQIGLDALLETQKQLPWKPLVEDAYSNVGYQLICNFFRHLVASC
jgi:hypothetical protein